MKCIVRSFVMWLWWVWVGVLNEAGITNPHSFGDCWYFSDIKFPITAEAKKSFGDIHSILLSMEWGEQLEGGWWVNWLNVKIFYSLSKSVLIVEKCLRALSLLFILVSGLIGIKPPSAFLILLNFIIISLPTVSLRPLQTNDVSFIRTFSHHLCVHTLQFIKF